jgi:hypothetical protein
MGDQKTSQQFCLPGLQGFPVQITGWEGLPEKRIIPNDITLQFLDAPVTMTNINGVFTFTGYNTFFLGGTNYQLRAFTLNAPMQVGLKNFSSEPLLEYQLWGVHFGSNGVADSLGVLIIPIRITSDLEPISVAADTLTKSIFGPVRLADLVPSGPKTTVVRYNTCVEVQNRPSINIQVAYWADGANMPQKDASGFIPNRTPSGIPNIFNGMALSAFEYNDETKQKSQLQFRYKSYLQYTNIVCEVYPSKILSATSTEVSLVFGVIQGFKTSAPRELRTAGYKCIAIDRMRDIQDGRLVVDPATGQRLDQVVKEADEETKDIDVPVPKEEQLSTWKTVAIVLGVFLGLTVLALLVYLAQTFFVDRKSTDLPDVSKVVQVAQQYTNSINEAPAAVSATT